jgi:thiamine-phosphate pyrophosphorylase
VALAREILGSQKIVGRSTTNKPEMEQAIAESADYIGVGPVFETPTKPGKAGIGLDYLSYVANKCPIPWFAIGGIDTDNASQVIAAGGRRLAVVRSIMEAEQPGLTVRQFLSRLAGDLSRRTRE